MTKIFFRSEPPASGPVAGDYSRLERAVWPVAVVLAAVFLTCLQFTATAPYKLATFAKMAHFQAPEPFQQRVLTPAIVAGLRQIVPANDAQLFGLLEWVGWIALILLAYRALVVFNVGRRDLFRRVLAFGVAVPMVMQVVVPYLYMPQAFVIDASGLDLGHWQTISPFYYVYDLPAAVFTLALVLMLIDQLERPSRRRLVAYFLVFALATANRETTVFVISFSALLFWRRLPRRRWLGLMLAQIAVFAAVELPLQWLFRGHTNPSPDAAFHSQYENHLLENLGLLTHPLFLTIMLARFMAGLYLPVLLWRRFLDRRLICALAGFALPLIVFALIAGRLQEHRIFVEAVPLIWVAAMRTVARRVGQPLAERESRPAPAADLTEEPRQPTVVPVRVAVGPARRNEPPAARDAGARPPLPKALR